MSEHSEEVEVAAAGHEVLPKEVTQEIGSVKLFNKWQVQIHRGEETGQLLITKFQELRGR
jgi:hypothetical protein